MVSRAVETAASEHFWSSAWAVPDRSARAAQASSSFLDLIETEYRDPRPAYRGAPGPVGLGAEMVSLRFRRSPGGDRLVQVEQRDVATGEGFSELIEETDRASGEPNVAGESEGQLRTGRSGLPRHIDR